MDMISTKEALQICKEKGYAVCGETIRIWCIEHGVGVKIGGLYKIDKNKLIDYIHKKTEEYQNVLKRHNQKWNSSTLPLCQCSCGMKVSKPTNKFILGHSRYPYRKK